MQVWMKKKITAERAQRGGVHRGVRAVRRSPPRSARSAAEPTAQHHEHKPTETRAPLLLCSTSSFPEIAVGVQHCDKRHGIISGLNTA